MKEGRVTIKDIAEELGISPSTVSRALKDHPDISPDTRKAVRELADKLHYEPDAIALSLKSRQTRILGLVIPDVVHHFFSTVISGIEQVASEAGYQIMICHSNETYEREVQSIHALLCSRVDGIMVSVSKDTRNYDHFRKVIQEEVPLVFFDRVCEEIETDRVEVDDYFGAYRAVEHLIEQGCRHIVHFAAPQTLTIGRNRMNGYMQALRDHNLSIDPDLIIKCDTYEQGIEVTEQIIQSKLTFDGIFAVNDLTAVGAMQVIKKHGIAIPEEVAIVGFTNGQITEIADPPLSSVEQHGYEMGTEVARLLLDRLMRKDNDYPPKIKIIKTKLDIKQSSLRTK
jgi:DNA-binding LacI/PurR family transcriptional regulator